MTLPTPDVYQFAVAANADRVSSGMIWATCTILHDKGDRTMIISLLTANILTK